MVIEMEYEHWFEKYLPHCENNQIRYYETFGQDLELVNSTDPLKVWTMLDHDFILNGKYFVNRLVYIVTRFPWRKDEEIEVRYE